MIQIKFEIQWGLDIWFFGIWFTVKEFKVKADDEHIRMDVYQEVSRYWPKNRFNRLVVGK